ncbi:hypothetical protein N7492_001283 [Penicillium capsulatum]|uniref:Uncharacterized protein n=1 Tax=Penicillium capsulatum TaxID=69766 RepID=A0A9W9M105_9EURO|nr:hypothetical protein N7492_001283 [Penicillium capsulatum]KAJ6129658.1 hypothetical protein N7512_002438 [Penicillium capsulatum]
MPSKTIFLMGAPLPGHLDWENDALFNTPVPPFQDSQTQEYQPSGVQTSAKWRVLRTLPLGESVDYYNVPHGPPAYLTSPQLETKHLNEDDSMLSQFYDHSFAVHETTQISASDLHEGTSTQTSSSGWDSGECTESCKDQVPDTAPRPRMPSICDLRNVPTARYLQSIAPQTMTVNLVVGVIAIHPPRRVVTRRWKKDLDIVELIVGDDTGTGFGVNFWLQPENSSGAKQDTDRLRRSLATLRPRDLALLRTVGLSSFQDRVYGQSLLGGMTQVELLHRRMVNSTDAGGLYPEIPARTIEDDQPLQKVRRVREWMARFVVTGRGNGARTPAQRGLELPPDSQ